MKTIDTVGQLIEILQRLPADAKPVVRCEMDGFCGLAEERFREIPVRPVTDDELRSWLGSLVISDEEDDPGRHLAVLIA